MPFDHNDHYHRLLLRQLPPQGHTALDVGCGAGRFARRLVAHGYRVDALDPDPATLAVAEAAGGGPRYRVADAAQAELPPAHYDVISCLASLHHMPFETLTRFRKALAPGGTLLVLGCYGGATQMPSRASPCTRASAPAASALPRRNHPCGNPKCGSRRSAGRPHACSPAARCANSSSGATC
ncbi:class I SAM-dependent methyltransferase [Streptomyces sp. UC4497]